MLQIGHQKNTFQLERESMENFLKPTSVIDWKTPAVLAKAHELAGQAKDARGAIRQCFEWVRDEIRHTGDWGLSPVTCAASEVLTAGSGFCYAKSHLLAALLRANGIPTGLCYQRLCMDDEGRQFCLHGLNAVWLPEIGWYRIDARGNRAGIDAQFSPPAERLAFVISREGEVDFPEVWADPLPVVVEALQSHDSAEGMRLPDVEVWQRD
jgi:transglutaminase-like putative cysteine protease